MKLWLNTDDVVQGTAEVVKEKTSQAKSTLALHRSVLKAVETWQYLSSTSSPDLTSLMSEIKQSGVLADSIATTVDLTDAQRWNCCRKLTVWHACAWCMPCCSRKTS